MKAVSLSRGPTGASAVSDNLFYNGNRLLLCSLSLTDLRLFRFTVHLGTRLLELARCLKAIGLPAAASPSHLAAGLLGSVVLQDGLLHV